MQIIRRLMQITVFKLFFKHNILSNVKNIRRIYIYKI